MDSWHSYPSIYGLGHRAIKDLLTVPVNVEEKIDGSQFSFALDENGEILVKSKGAQLVVDAPDKMFTKAVATVIELKDKLYPGWTYRAEYLQKPHHNALTYNRAPEKHLIIFDVNTGQEEYMDWDHKNVEAIRLGLECVPLIYSGMVASAEQFHGFLDRESILGGPKVEGVVVKPTAYNLYGLDKKVLMGKFVSEAFKEVHRTEWKAANPGKGDVVDSLVTELKTEARWCKAIQHLREAGRIEDSPRDIGILLKEISQDMLKECEGEIKEMLFKWAWPQISRRVIAGFPEYYKEKLLAQQFEPHEF